MTVDPYIDPAHGVLRNKLGIVASERLSQAEADISYVAMADLAVRILPGNYDLEHLQAFHYEIFRDLYEWAGETRTVNIAKTDLFCVHQHIRSYASEVFDTLAKENHLRGLARGSFLARITHYFGEVNAIHPFREGNGRAQRAFFHQLSRAAGWPIDWSNLDSEANVAASIASLRGDHRSLQAMLDRLISE